MASSITRPSPIKEQPSELEAEKKEQELSTHPPDDLETENKEQDLSISPSDGIQPEPDQVFEPGPDAPPATQ
jgi:hypothetical protein